MLKLLQGLRRRQEGATAVEFALVAPLFFIVMWGTMEAGMLILASTMLEGAVREAARVGVTGYSPTGTDRATHIKNAVDTYTGKLLDISKVTIGTTVYPNFSAAGTGTGGASGVGNTGEIVQYTLTYPWTFFTGNYAATIFGSSTVTLTAKLVVRNEPF